MESANFMQTTPLAKTNVSLSLDNLDFVRELVARQAAVVLGPEKGYLAESRLLSLAKEKGHASVNDFVTWLRTVSDAGLRRRVVEAMTTNETSFFRDSHPFEGLRKCIIPGLIERRAQQRSLSIWSAACSTGQEPYSIAMLLKEYFPSLSNWNVRILASDLCTGILDRARAGRYGQLEVNRGLPAAMLLKFFQRDGLDWQIDESVRKLVQFQQFNLAADPWPALPQMDIVFLRNVLIYFDMPTKQQILAKIRRLLRPDGYLFLGGAETTLNVDEAFEYVSFERAKCYRLRDGGAFAIDPCRDAPCMVGF